MRGSYRLAAVACALGLVVAACSEDSGDGDAADTTAAPAEETTVAPETTEAPAEESTTSAAAGDDNAERDQVGLDYVGAAEASEAAGEPVVIGYVNQEGATPAFPENTVGLEAAVDYINSTLGGVQGRPVEIKKCVVQKEEDGQKCAQEMLADESVQYVLTGILVLGNQPLYDTLAGQKPVFIGNPVTTPDFLAKDALRLHTRLARGHPGHGHLRGDHAAGRQAREGRRRLLGQRRRAGRVQPADEADPRGQRRGRDGCAHPRHGRSAGLRTGHPGRRGR